MDISYIKAGLKYKWGRLVYHVWVKPIGWIKWISWKNKPQILSHEKTLMRLIDERNSICRFGDGELNIAWGKSIGFQNNSEKLILRMNEVLHSQNPKILVGLPDIFYSLKHYSAGGGRWWNEFRLTNVDNLRKSLSNVKTAVNTNITRFTSDYKEDMAEVLVPLFKQIWEGRDITIVEGCKSRLGVGNDLFVNAKTIHRILCPAKGAFDVYDEIMDSCKELIPKDNVVIIALGPTATILAYDLALAGYQALDLGHIDIQYEYHLRGIRSKTPIPGKYVNEGGTAGQTVDDSAIDMSYTGQVIKEIE